jgi:hypothetical protein
MAASNMAVHDGQMNGSGALKRTSERTAAAGHIGQTKYGGALEQTNERTDDGDSGAH